MKPMHAPKTANVKNCVIVPSTGTGDSGAVIHFRLEDDSQVLVALDPTKAVLIAEAMCNLLPSFREMLRKEEEES